MTVATVASQHYLDHRLRTTRRLLGVLCAIPLLHLTLLVGVIHRHCQFGLFVDGLRPVVTGGVAAVWDRAVHRMVASSLSTGVAIADIRIKTHNAQ